MVAPHYGYYERTALVPHAKKYGSRDDPTIRAGMLVCTIHTTQFECYNWRKPEKIDSRIFGHPGVILDVRGDDVHLLVMSSIPLDGRAENVRMQHLPISPKGSHPDTGEQLLLKSGKCNSNSCVKVHQVYILPKRILLKNRDARTQVELELRAESLDYVRRAVDEFEPEHFSRQLLRPFQGYPETVRHPIKRKGYLGDRYTSPWRSPSFPRSSRPPAQQQTRSHNYGRDVRYQPYNNWRRF
ncbi:MAG: hypothetical protein HETSPECPRED_002509 [Heterodermia speciosa]|uniref:Uncharacterized protein n=1 Tax=Heterodermia speciosa TaxID=116794 RepID=A0A8H3F742_9LECA|nr:MAG: hypothetical protein HETSPECPRED_002509 [Heterodermia speciosa]